MEIVVFGIVRVSSGRSWESLREVCSKNVTEAEAVGLPFEAMGGALMRLHLDALPYARLQLFGDILADPVEQG